ncbi:MULTISPECIES: FKBP-type peptidyl-prolyl cis-trans isomerase [Flectobacillus]|jgi:FKBP-type peptidyl-prolyl cis-trans isomerase SlyD|uniref:Peptidyl-prolyl cis-trans isomerase n=1 Tax=Flectobacillus roseus TaxID=502259 RepID=A0ABT6Y4D7_9BACT|nr:MULTISPECIES: peptidylprolyl isomerase [Flectobacillus]MDI9858425.1 peptidylprolyl isomerase [Flectobacillus roseus]MDI9867646.1 peptidylprolyl isomerase [Flectobacillus roseus]PAC28374.1 peptidylprolyl isomerase [Flectobacillus sp. BAB-3569]
MQISNAKVVSLTYQLTVTDKNGDRELVETVEQEHPMVFIHGMSGLPEAFEDKIAGLSAGDTFEFSIPAEEGYGEYDASAVVELPKDIFKVDGELVEEMLEVGNFLPMTDDRGNRLQGQIIEVGEDFVRMDFNHPLADKEMFFSGAILSVREATESELDHGHVHGEGGVHH